MSSMENASGSLSSGQARKEKAMKVDDLSEICMAFVLKKKALTVSLWFWQLSLSYLSPLDCE